MWSYQNCSKLSICLDNLKSTMVYSIKWQISGFLCSLQSTIIAKKTSKLCLKNILCHCVKWGMNFDVQNCIAYLHDHKSCICGTIGSWRSMNLFTKTCSQSKVIMNFYLITLCQKNLPEGKLWPVIHVFLSLLFQSGLELLRLQNSVICPNLSHKIFHNVYTTVLIFKITSIKWMTSY